MTLQVRMAISLDIVVGNAPEEELTPDYKAAAEK